MKAKRLISWVCIIVICFSAKNIFAAEYLNVNYSMSSWFDSEPWVAAWFNSGCKVTAEEAKNANKVSPLKMYEGNYVTQCSVRLSEGNYDKTSRSGYWRPSARRYDEVILSKSFNNPFLDCKQYVSFLPTSTYK